MAIPFPRKKVTERLFAFLFFDDSFRERSLDRTCHSLRFSRQLTLFVRTEENEMKLGLELGLELGLGLGLKLGLQKTRIFRLGPIAY